MKMSFRWYGESDPISLQYISQIPNMRSVVSAVYDVKPGYGLYERALGAVYINGLFETCEKTKWIQ